MEEFKSQVKSYLVLDMHNYRENWPNQREKEISPPNNYFQT